MLVLFDPIMQVAGSPPEELCGEYGFRLQRCHCGLGGGIAVKGKLRWDAVLLDRLLQAPLGRGTCAPFTYEKVDCLSLFVHPAIQIDPLS